MLVSVPGTAWPLIVLSPVDSFFGGLSCVLEQWLPKRVQLAKQVLLTSSSQLTALLPWLWVSWGAAGQESRRNYETMFGSLQQIHRPLPSPPGSRFKRFYICSLLHRLLLSAQWRKMTQCLPSRKTANGPGSGAAQTGWKNLQFINLQATLSRSSMKAEDISYN